MGLIKEPKNIDLTIKSEPWTKEELIMFREVMKKKRDKKRKLTGGLASRGRAKNKSTM